MLQSLTGPWLLLMSAACYLSACLFPVIPASFQLHCAEPETPLTIAHFLPGFCFSFVLSSFCVYSISPPVSLQPDQVFGTLLRLTTRGGRHSRTVYSPPMLYRSHYPRCSALTRPDITAHHHPVLRSPSSHHHPQPSISKPLLIP